MIAKDILISVALGWVLLGTVVIQVLAIALRKIIALLGVSLSRFRVVGITLLVYAILATLLIVARYSDMAIDWVEVAVIYSPLVLAPVLSFVGFQTWKTV